jgi:thymidylate synthase (FAD)
MNLIKLANSSDMHDNYGSLEDGVFKGIDLPPEGFWGLSEEFQVGDTIMGVEQNIQPPEHSEVALEEGSVIGVLNHGFVELQEVQGSDEAIVAAARTSYATSSKSAKDEVLLRYLLRNHHTTPIEMAGMKLRLYIPIVVYRQLFRHRTAVQLEPQFLSNDTAFAKYSVQNEMSGRYVELPDHFYLPEARRIQQQSKTNKQGSEADSMTLEEQQEIRKCFEASNQNARQQYDTLLKMNVAKETARNVLPLTQYTLLVWKLDLKNMLHFLGLRLDKHAQWEVRQYAEAMSMFVKRYFPWVWQAFCDYHLNAVRLSSSEHDALLINMTTDQREAALKSFSLIVENKREQQEFRSKLGL